LFEHKGVIDIVLIVLCCLELKRGKHRMVLKINKKCAWTSYGFIRVVKYYERNIYTLQSASSISQQFKGAIVFIIIFKMYIKQLQIIILVNLIM